MKKKATRRDTIMATTTASRPKAVAANTMAVAPAPAVAARQPAVHQPPLIMVAVDRRLLRWLALAVRQAPVIEVACPRLIRRMGPRAMEETVAAALVAVSIRVQVAAVVGDPAAVVAAASATADQIKEPSSD